MTPPGDSSGSTYIIEAKVSDGSLLMTHQINLRSLAAATGNQAPIFSPALASKSTRAGVRLTFAIGATDPEGQAVTITFNPSGTQANFIKFSTATKTFNIMPWNGDKGTHQISVTASDGVATTTTSFTLTVLTNLAPSFETNLVDQNYNNNLNEYFYTLPNMKDPDSTVINFYLGTGTPNFISKSNGSIRIRPADSGCT